MVGINKNDPGSWNILAYQGKETLESKAFGPHIPEAPLAIVTFLQLLLGSQERWSAHGIVRSHQAQGVSTMRSDMGALV